MAFTARSPHSNEFTRRLLLIRRKLHSVHRDHHDEAVVRERHVLGIAHAEVDVLPVSLCPRVRPFDQSRHVVEAGDLTGPPLCNQSRGSTPTRHVQDTFHGMWIDRFAECPGHWVS